MRLLTLSLLLLALPALAQTPQSAPAPANPPKPALPKVVLVGDSIRLGYAPLVAKKLEGVVQIISPTPNGADTKNVLMHLDKWIISEKPTLVHFNCGLHDLKKLKADGSYQVPLDAYGKNLQTIVERIQKETTATVVFASTTPIVNERHAARKANFDRFEADVRKYNEKAIAVMHAAKIPVHDLHALVHHYGAEKLLGGDGTHYTPAGNEILAEAVADTIRRQLAVLQTTPRLAPAPTKQAAQDYTEAEKKADALVPKYYRELKAPEFAIPKDAAEWNKRRQDLKEKVIASLGDLPPRPKTPKIQMISIEQRPGFRLEKFTIDNDAGSLIPMILLIPQGLTKPAPAILWLHSSGHDHTDILAPNHNGGEEPLGTVLLKKGYVVLSLDNWWHGERAGMGPAGTREKQNEEQQSLFKLHLWMGRTLWGMFVRDDQIALDYLCSRPEVNATKIGATGRSMGSTRAWWLAAVDERITCTVGVACLTRYSNLIAHGQLRQHGIYYFVNGLMKTCDTEGVLALIAPRPFLGLTGELDAGSPADGIRILETKVAGVYKAINAPERFRNVLYPETGHVHTSEMREETLTWFDRWLQPGK